MGSNRSVLRAGGAEHSGIGNGGAGKEIIDGMRNERRGDLGRGVIWGLMIDFAGVGCGRWHWSFFGFEC